MSAFETLYRANVNKVYGLSYRLAGDALLAEELTQDVFVRAWQKLATFRGDSAFSSWLYPLAINVILGERRSRQRRNARVTTAADLARVAGPVESRPALRLDLEQAIAKLPAGARCIFLLHDVEGHGHDEIARITGVTPGTSKAQLHRARRLLREALRS
jgi:RNA polymerase sigma-70 factor (ECF subfamily)